ncbi:class IV adenylate cyclase [Peterkaempfera bronchialis]|uniref:Class IV adenylate cyclase n=1 Tax=Peterkaempfera bronchialis TaxID=2126346 RepID=A0A345SXE5_9ACTN|nr:class IV adenylate cyclase [Peterkaempfera bronchialis]AXI78400.1 class IV adenylate cyclase [Peterkaempfera bronchialis]
MIEAELKAMVHDPEGVLQRLEALSEGRPEVYQDTYYDNPSGSLGRGDQELRVRTVHGQENTRSVLTYKGPRVDAASASKTEHETVVDDPDAVHAMLRGLGYLPTIRFEKRCRNYDFESAGRRMLATLVRVPELDGTFLEVETLADAGDLAAALKDVRAVVQQLGITDADLTTELYTDAVAERRRAAPQA